MGIGWGWGWGGGGDGVGWGRGIKLFPSCVAHFGKTCSLILQEVPHDCSISMSTDDSLTRRTVGQPKQQLDLMHSSRHKERLSNLVVMETTYDSVAYMVCDLLPLAPAILTWSKGVMITWYVLNDTLVYACLPIRLTKDEGRLLTRPH